jgi:hypothetical protein
MMTALSVMGHHLGLTDDAIFGAYAELAQPSCGRGDYPLRMPPHQHSTRIDRCRHHGRPL